MELIKQQQKKARTETGGEVFGMDETGLMVRVLQFKELKVEEKMTPIKDVFMLECQSKLDFDCLASIFQSGHSRIPIYQGTQQQIVGMLFAKDLIMLNSEDEFLVNDLLKFYNHYPEFVWNDDTCDVVLESFKSGKSHMAIVRQVVEYDDGRDSEYENTGIITLEVGTTQSVHTFLSSFCFDLRTASSLSLPPFPGLYRGPYRGHHRRDRRLR